MADTNNVYLPHSSNMREKETEMQESLYALSIHAARMFFCQTKCKWMRRNSDSSLLLKLAACTWAPTITQTDHRSGWSVG